MNPPTTVQENQGSAARPATVSPGDAELEALYDRAKTFTDTARDFAAVSRRSFRYIRSSADADRSRALLILADLLEDRAERERILAENAKDLAAAETSGLKASLVDRLRLNEKRLGDMIQALREIAAMPDPLGEVVLGRRLSNGVEMIQKRVPMGVVFTIYESRPNVTVDVGALCVKSGNCAILRGGKEAVHTNRILHELFRTALERAGLPGDAVQLVSETDRAYMLALLQQDDLIDLVVPRGGEQLIRFISANSRIPVVKHDKGVCTIFVDESADYTQALSIIANAKLQRPSVCNAAENLLIHTAFPEKARLLRELSEAGVRLLGDDATCSLFPGARAIADPDEEYATEYLDERLSVKVVGGVDEAVDFIYRYGSGHSEAILSNNQNHIRRFQDNVDSAAVFVNCSTRFHDGGQMGFGAEVGISTGRMHVRGPMGVRDLTTTTYVMTGSGQIRE